MILHVNPDCGCQVAFHTEEAVHTPCEVHRLKEARSDLVRVVSRAIRDCRVEQRAGEYRAERRVSA